MQVVVEEDDTECVVCMADIKEMVLIPCGHMMLCVACCAKVQSSSVKECPMCRCNIEYSFRMPQ